MREPGSGYRAWWEAIRGKHGKGVAAGLILITAGALLAYCAIAGLLGEAIFGVR